MNTLLQQKRIYYSFNFINRFMLYMPVFVLFLKMKGLNQTQIMIMMSAYNLAIMVGEVPTGVLADKVSRKASVMTGCIIQGISMLLMIPLSNIIVLVIIEVIFGIGMTFQSGAMSAMFYDYLKSIGKEDIYPDIEGKRWACVFVSQALASLAGGILANYNISLTVVFTGSAYIISAVILIGFKEVYVKRERESNYFQHAAVTLKYILTTKRITTLLIIMVFTGALFSTTMWLYQPYYQEIGIKVSTYGIAYFLMNSVSALGGFLSGKMNLSYKKVIVCYVCGNVIFIGMMGIVNSKIGVILPAFVFLVNGLINPWIQSFWEKNIESTERATASSLLSLISSLIFAAIAIPIGYISDSFNVFTAMAMSVVVYIIIIIILYLANRFLTHNNAQEPLE